MNIILNTSAAGGNAKDKWTLVKEFIFKKFDDVFVADVRENDSIEGLIQNSISKGADDFIIAGGDGTINYFINKIMEVQDEKVVKNIKIGVVGIGSSNDFCKPFSPEIFINNIPCIINFSNTQLRDVGVIKYRSKDQILHKYFLLNASIGITAAANLLFNKPDLALKFLKKYFTPIAILYAALKTILTYKNFEGEIIFNPYEAYSFRISNLSIVKNPNISGDLSYPGKADYQNGVYDIYLTHSMNKLDLITLLKSLSMQIFPKNEKTKYCKTSKIKVTAENDFLIEFDGEIIKTNYAEFSILNKYLNICTN